MYFIPAIISLQYPLFVFKWAINPISDWLSLCYCLKIQYKEDLGGGTALSDTPEMDRVKRNQTNISTVHYSVTLLFFSSPLHPSSLKLHFHAIGSMLTPPTTNTVPRFKKLENIMV